MVKRRLTLKRIDPWSVLKFGFIANIALLAIVLLGGAVVWFFIRRLGLIESVCEIAIDVGFLECGVSGGNLFRAALLLGALGVIVQTGVWVFLAFLHNLIADLVGGLQFTYADDRPVSAQATTGRSAQPAQAPRSTGSPAPAPASTREQAPIGSSDAGGSWATSSEPSGGQPSGGPSGQQSGRPADRPSSQPTERREEDIFARRNPTSDDSWPTRGTE